MVSRETPPYTHVHRTGQYLLIPYDELLKLSTMMRMCPCGCKTAISTDPPPQDGLGSDRRR